jgi:hypothetical protein
MKRKASISYYEAIIQRFRKVQPPHKWTLRSPDPEGRESTVPFLSWRATFLFRDMADQAVPCHFAMEVDARYVPPSKEPCVLYC